MTPEERQAKQAELEKLRELATLKTRRDEMMRSEQPAARDAPPQPPADFTLPRSVMGVQMPFADSPTDRTRTRTGKTVDVPRDAPIGAKRALIESIDRGVETGRQDAVLDAAGGSPVGVMGSLGALLPQNLRRKVGAANLGLVDAGTFGFSDELAGAVNGDEARDASRFATRAAFEREPASAIVGGLSTAALPMGPLSTVRQATMAGRVRQGLLSGSAFGALYGAGSAEGNLIDRGLGATIGGTAGAAFGAALPLGSKFVQFTGRKATPASVRAFASRVANGQSRGLASAEEVRLLDDAIGQVQRIYGGSREQAQQRLINGLNDAQLNDLMFEVLDDQAMAVAVGAGSRQGPGRQIARDALVPRAEGQNQRLREMMTRIAGGEDIATSQAALSGYKAKEGKQAYQKAFAFEPNVADQRIAGEVAEVEAMLSNRPALEAGRREAQERLNNQFGRGNPQANIDNMPLFQRAQLAKESLDDQIGAALRAGEKGRARGLMELRDDLLSRLDRINPDYAAARNVWAGASANENALLLGESVFKPGSKLRDIEAAFAKMSEAEQAHYIVGMMDAASEMVGRSGETAAANSASRFVPQNIRDKVRAILPRETADDFLSTLDREGRQQANASAVLPGIGSQTASRGEGVRAFEEATASGPGGLAANLADDPKGTLTLKNTRRDMSQSLRNNEQGQRNMAEFLFSRVEDNPLYRRVSPGGGNAPPPGGPPPQNTLATPPAPAVPASAPPSAVPRPSLPANQNQRPNPYLGRKSFRGAEEARGPNPGAPLSPPASVREPVPLSAYDEAAPVAAPSRFPGGKPKQPSTLTQAVKSMGGLKVWREGPTGRQSFWGGDFESVPGLINNRNGQTADDMVRALQEDGFDIVDEDDLFRALNNERAGQKTYRIGEGEEYEIAMDSYNAWRSQTPDDPVSSGARADIAGLLTAGGMLTAAGSVGGEDSPVGRARNALAELLANAELPETSAQRFERMRSQQRQANSSYIPQNALTAAQQGGQNLAAQAMLVRRQQLQGGPQPDNAFAPNRVAEMQRGLQDAVESGQMTIEEAAAEMDKHLVRFGLPRSQNPFRAQQAG